MNTKELRDKIGNSSFNAIIKHPYYKEHLASSYHDPVFHHETTASGSHSTIKADIPFGGKKKTITFQYHKNKVYNAHYALDGKHIKSHKEVNEDRYQDKPIHRLLGTTSLTNIYKQDTPGQKMSIAKKIIKSIQEAKIGDKVQITHGSQKGLVGHVGEIRKGVAKGDHTYTVDYDDNGKRQSVQVKKAHTKLMKENNDELNKKTPSEEDIMKKHGMNKTELDHHLAIGIKVEMEHTKNAAVAREIALDHINEKPDYYAKLKKMVEEEHPELKAIRAQYEKHEGPGSFDKRSHQYSDDGRVYRRGQALVNKYNEKKKELEKNEEAIVEVSKQLMGRYVQKAATSMASAAFGQGQASASLRPPSEKDQKTGFKRMQGIVRATHKMAKEETIQEETSASLKKMSDYHAKEAEYHDKHAMNKDHSEDRRKGHALARSSHYSAAEHYLKASRADNDMQREYHIDKAEKHADSAEEREREHRLMEDVKLDELNQMTLSRYAATARVKAMNKNDPKRKQRVIGTSRAYSKLSRGDFSEEIEQVDELKKSTMQSYLNKTVDPDLGMPKDTKKPAQRIKGIERASKKIISKVNEQQYLTIPDVKEKEHKRATQQRQSRRSYISSRNSEARRMYKEETELKPHRVSVQLKHPAYQGITNKVVKVNATDTKHAEDIVATHYGRRGFKVHKVDYSKAHKEEFPKNQQEKAKEAEAKEDNKIKKIASAIKDATK